MRFLDFRKTETKTAYRKFKLIYLQNREKYKQKIYLVKYSNANH